MACWLVALYIIALSALAAAAEPRVITLNPAATEIVFALGHGNSLVGTVNESDEPKAAMAIARIGSYGRPNVEKIIQLKPTVVFTFREGIDHVGGTLERAGIKLIVLDGKELDDYPQIVESIGNELGAHSKARSLVESWKKEWAALNKSPQSASLVLQLERAPLIVAGGDTFLSQIVSRCGLKNAFAHLNGYPTLSREAIHERPSDLIVVLIEKLSPGDRSSIRETWKASPLSKSKKILFYDPHRLSRLTPALAGESKRFCKALTDAI